MFFKNVIQSKQELEPEILTQKAVAQILEAGYLFNYFRQNYFCFGSLLSELNFIINQDFFILHCLALLCFLLALSSYEDHHHHLLNCLIIDLAMLQSIIYDIQIKLCMICEDLETNFFITQASRVLYYFMQQVFMAFMVKAQLFNLFVNFLEHFVV